MPFDPTDERERTPWRAGTTRWRLPGLPQSFENRLLLIGGVLVVLDFLHLARSFASEFTGLLMLPVSLIRTLGQWLSAW
jgi:hypothetical protein